MGVITGVNETNVRIDYDVDDYSGPVLKVKTFNDEEGDDMEMSKRKILSIGTHVRVYGPIRTIGGDRAIAGFKVTMC